MNEDRVFANLMATIVILTLACAALWLLNFLDRKHKIELCVEAGRRDCLQKFDPEASP